MKIQNYVKQAWQLMLQNKLFSALYILGTALAISFTVIMAVVYYVKLAPIYPEYQRIRTLTAGQPAMKWKSGMMASSLYSPKAVKEWLYPLKNVELVSGHFATGGYWAKSVDGTEHEVETMMADPAFFKLYQFDFLEGTPFSQADFDSGIHNVVITKELARKVFNTSQEVVGRVLQLNFVDYRVCGVVKTPSLLIADSYASVYMPYSIYLKDETEYLGNMTVSLLVKDKAQRKALNEEILQLKKSINQQHEDEWEVDFKLPKSNMEINFGSEIWYNWGGGSEKAFSYWQIVKTLLPILLVLLIIPALNLSGMISSRMEERLAEMGVRKSFGASRGTLLSQILWENMTLTLAGGIVGFIIAIVVLFAGRGWVFELINTGNFPHTAIGETQVTGEMLFSPFVFLIAFLICVVVNLMSALLPAWRSLRNPIIASINEKR